MYTIYFFCDNNGIIEFSLFRGATLESYVLTCEHNERGNEKNIIKNIYN